MDPTQTGSGWLLLKMLYYISNIFKHCLGGGSFLIGFATLSLENSNNFPIVVGEEMGHDMQLDVLI